MISTCTCVNEYMDEKYGKNMRVFNELPRKGFDLVGRCTSCGKERIYKEKK